MADHSLLAWIRDRAAFEFFHRGEGTGGVRFHGSKVIVGKTHPADVDGDVEIRVVKKMFLETRPKGRDSHGAMISVVLFQLEHANQRHGGAGGP